jgi:hypothetical protein
MAPAHGRHARPSRGGDECACGEESDELPRVSILGTVG